MLALLLLATGASALCVPNPAHTEYHCSSLEEAGALQLYPPRAGGVVDVSGDGSTLDELDRTKLPAWAESVYLSGCVGSVEGGAFADMGGLRRVVLRDNDVPELYAGSFASVTVTEIAITGCRVRAVYPGAFEDTPNLKSLSIVNNEVISVHRRVFNGLRVKALRLFNNKIAYTARECFENMTDLEELFLEENRLRSFNSTALFGDRSNLTLLNLEKNRLSEIDEHSFASLQKLKILILSYNKISYVRKGTFNQNTILEKLYLDHNEMTTLDIQSFPKEGLPQLNFLSIDKNRLMFMSSFLLRRFPGLQMMTLEGNPWKCTCVEVLNNRLNAMGIRRPYSEYGYFQGKKPMCVITRREPDKCSGDYDDEASRKFLQIDRATSLDSSAHHMFESKLIL